MKDGVVIAGDAFYNYDEDHKRKMRELTDLDTRYLYLVEKKCGIDPYEDNYDGPDNDIRIVNVDHFAIRAELKDRAEEFREIVYNAIDEVYNSLPEADKAPEDDDFDLDGLWGIEDDDY